MTAFKVPKPPSRGTHYPIEYNARFVVKNKGFRSNNHHMVRYVFEDGVSAHPYFGWTESIDGVGVFASIFSWNENTDEWDPYYRLDPTFKTTKLKDIRSQEDVKKKGDSLNDAFWEEAPRNTWLTKWKEIEQQVKVWKEHVEGEEEVEVAESERHGLEVNGKLESSDIITTELIYDPRS